MSGEPEETAVYEAMARQYETLHRGFRVEVVRVPEKDDHQAWRCCRRRWAPATPRTCSQTGSTVLFVVAEELG